jgi:hypothetical protein
LGGGGCPIYSLDLTAAFLLFPKLKIVLKGVRFKAISLIQQTVVRELKVIAEERFLGHSVHCMSIVNAVPKQTGTVLNDSINTYVLSFVCGFYGLTSVT